MACSVKQQVWFLAPFLLVAICRSRDARTSLQAGVTALVCFVSVNGYYLWHDPAEWYEGLSTPFFHPLVREGIGLVRLEQGGLLGPIEQWVYLLLAASTFCGLLVAYWKWFERLAPLGPVLGLLPVYLSWRSHAASFYLLPMLLLTGLAVGRPVQPKNRPGKTAP